MIEEQGVVVTLDGDYVEVRTERRGTCGGCSADGACGISLLDRFLGRRVVLVRARNPVGAWVGERVVVAVSEAGLVRAALAAYLMPILGLVVGAMAGQRAGGDTWSLLCGVLGFLLALYWLRRYSAASARDPGRNPIVLRRLDGEPRPLPLSAPGRSSTGQ